MIIYFFLHCFLELREVFFILCSQLYMASGFDVDFIARVGFVGPPSHFVALVHG
jgi:hypothetical protein